jgi:hypothetical protein
MATAPYLYQDFILSCIQLSFQDQEPETWNLELLEPGTIRTWNYWNLELLEHGTIGTLEPGTIGTLEPGTWNPSPSFVGFRTGPESTISATFEK